MSSIGHNQLQLRHQYLQIRLFIYSGNSNKYRKMMPKRVSTKPFVYILGWSITQDCRVVPLKKAVITTANYHILFDYTVETILPAIDVDKHFSATTTEYIQTTPKTRWSQSVMVSFHLALDHLEKTSIILKVLANI